MAENQIAVTVTSSNDISVTVGTTTVAVNAVAVVPPGFGAGLNLTDYSVQGQTLAYSSGSQTVNVDNGNTAQITLSGSLTSLAVSGWPDSGLEGRCTLYIVQGSGGPYSVASWDSAIKWVGGVPPVLSTTAADTDVIVLTTVDGGTTVIGTHVGTAS